MVDGRACRHRVIVVNDKEEEEEEEEEGECNKLKNKKTIRYILPL